MLSELAFHFILCLFIMTVTINAVFDVTVTVTKGSGLSACDTVVVAGWVV